MDRKEIESAYDVSEGYIKSLGKFESEPVFAPYFYNAMLEGCSEILDWSDGTRTDVFEIDADDRAMFPELGDGTVAVALTESEQGFVHVEELTALELEELRERNEKNADE